MLADAVEFYLQFLVDYLLHYSPLNILDISLLRGHSTPRWLRKITLDRSITM